MDFDDIDPRDWAAAKRRAEVLSELPERPSGERLRDAMTALGVGRTTLFRWLKLFRDGARTSALLPRRRGPHSGMRPLPPEVLAIVERHFRDFYATRRRPTVTRFWAEVAADCRREGLPVPSIRRLRRWLARHDAAELLRRREGKGKSEPVFLATPGTLEAAAPLAIMQIDHTKVDVTVVDPVTRLPIGRPTLTLAIDVATRMAMGFHLSLEAPSLTAVALCLTHAVMDKTDWLAARGIEADWPARGMPRVVHVDNGAEFHALALERACVEHGVDLVYRPPGTPRFGGHIERLIGTMMGAVHLIPGSHFSNIRERGDLDPEPQAVMTLRELETYFALEIVGAYHARIHRALEAPPVGGLAGAHRRGRGANARRSQAVSDRFSSLPSRVFCDATVCTSTTSVIGRTNCAGSWGEAPRNSPSNTTRAISRWSTCGSRRGIWKRAPRIERGRPSRFGSTARRCGFYARRAAGRSTRS